MPIARRLRVIKGVANVPRETGLSIYDVVYPRIWYCVSASRNTRFSTTDTKSPEQFAFRDINP